MKYWLYIFLFLFNSAFAGAQVLKGTIRDVEKNPVPYATVYIQELKQGTTANARGDYEIRLPEGRYTVIYQSLGFEPDLKNVTISKDPAIINVILQVQYYEIPEVRITASSEDPAYGIMRKTIGLAPYYLHHVNHYKAQVYLKGNLIIKNIPRIMQRSLRIEARNNSGTSASTTTMKEGDVYLMESVNDIEFTAPDKYIQRVISFNSTFPEQGNQISPMDFIEASFYEPVLADLAISPLSPDAFSHYNFKYKGASVQGNYVIDKIEVTPKRKSQQLFTGLIYIIEDLWCLHSLDLVNENIAGTIRIQQLYIPVQEEVWMPVSHKFDVTLSILGIKADAGYGSSIKYDEVDINPDLQKPPTISVDYRKNRVDNLPDTTKTRTQQQIEKILSKDEMTNRDMVKLSGLLEKESKESIADSIRDNLEIKNNVTHIIEKDAGKKDSAYWTEIRPIPLSEAETRSLRTADSVKSALKTIDTGLDSTYTGNRSGRKIKTAFNHLLWGHTWRDTLGFSFTNGGLIDLQNLQFNTVDGFVYGIDFRMNKQFSNNNSFSVYPDFRWAFSRKSFMWRINGNYRFNRMKQSQISFRAGIASKDFNSTGGINPFLNSITSLFMERNYMKLYETRYFTAGYRTEIANGLYLDLSVGYDDRRILFNNTTFSIIDTKRSYTDNMPGNEYITNWSDPGYRPVNHTHSDFNITFSYTPRQQYSINNNIKSPRGSEYPTFSISWKHGYNEKTAVSEGGHFDLLRIEASKRNETGAFGEFRWRLRTGGFINSDGANYFDFVHFNTQPLPVLLNDYEDAFHLPGYYKMCTPGYFTEFHLKYTTPYLLIKLLPVLSNTLMRENIGLSFLWMSDHDTYTEVGYTISEFLLLGEIGVYAGFYNFNYENLGFKLILKIN